MRTEFLSNGWIEVTTKTFTVSAVGQRPISTVEKWLEFNKKQPKIGAKRRACKCCKKKWESLSGNVHIVFTNHGNQSVCDACADFLK